MSQPPHTNRCNSTTRLRPLAAALEFALNNSAVGSLPILGIMAVGSLLVSIPLPAMAACSTTGPLNTLTCTGSSSTTLGGRNNDGRPYTINSGSAQTNMTITTSGDGATGIVADARGTPTGIVFDIIPAGPGGNSGAVEINNFANITTHGDKASGIIAQSQAGGFPAAIISPFQSLLTENGAFLSAFLVTQVDGQTDNVGTPVVGKSLIDVGGVLTQVNSGTFTINANGGAPVFDPGHDFDDLAVGESRTSMVSYGLTNLLAFISPYLPSSSASLVATVTRTGAGFTTVFGVNFAQYGTSSTARAQTSLLPDASGYITRFLQNFAQSGAANTVTVNSSGTIDTFGQSSHGIFAQSKGGEGLNGDDSLGNGDPGGPGRAGGTVDVTNNSVITTRGLNANGIVARSIGGNGGIGGDSDVAGSGGAGGYGGAGGMVIVDNNNDIVTRGAFSTAIIAQSLGGSAAEGGDGGWFYGPAGGGGASGYGGNVLVNNSGNITATGPKSLGIFAQSVGGFAGNGGDASGFIAFGANGGSSGRGGNVDIINDGIIRSTAEAIFAQSIGGGGGNAGTGNGLIFTGGGDGRRGGDGGVITITNSGQLETSQASAMGIFAQSVGGGGGNGGDGLSFSLLGGQSLGGDGSAAGNGGRITVNNNDAPISTHGDFAHGIYGLSVGGGGGFAGNAQTITVGSAFALALSSGGNGASGGYGETVTINSSGNILTAGSQAFGIGAQSIGGGGGGGGSAVSIAVALPPPDGAPEGTPTVSLAIAMGGRGSSGGNGGTVNVGQNQNNPITGNIETTGFRSYGILAQSVGGGGGDGGFSTAGAITLQGSHRFGISLGGEAGAGGNGGYVNVHSASTTSTTGDFAYGILAQSIGGGGGSGGSSVALTFEPVPQTTAAPDPDEPEDLTTLNLAMGGVGGAGGIGGAVLIDGNGGSIHTQGAFAHGILAQSIGGGGGAGGSTISSNLGLFFNTDTMRASLGLGGWSIPGDGAYGQNGGTVTINIEADIETEKNFSNGILAQSIGGGGGAGGVSFNTDLGTLMSNGIIYGELFPELNYPGGGAVKRSGNGSTVRVESTGDIITRGDFSSGILAQSIGGGGGTGGVNISDPTQAGPVSLSGSSGTIRGDSGMMFAGTAGGVGSGGAITVIHNGNITASGANSHGIFAQSAGNVGSTRNNISVTVDNGTVQGGSGGSAGISIHDGLSNSVTILANGTVTTLNALSVPSYSSGGYGPFAIFGTGGSETVNNYGAVIGNVNLGSGGNAFNNKQGGTLVSGPQVQIGGTLRNDGTISPGGVGNVFNTLVSGNLVQGSTGDLSLDLDFATGTADRINVSGTASLAGSVVINALNLEQITPGNRQVTILSSAYSGDLSNLTLAYAPSAAIRYELLQPNPSGVVLSYNVDFAPSPEAGGNQSAIGNYVNAIQQAGGTAEFNPIMLRLLSMPDDASLANAYDQLSPEPLLATATSAVLSDLRFSDALHSCRVREGAFRFVSEGECSWVRLIGSKLDQDRTDSNVGFTRKSHSLVAGAQKRVNENWHAGLGFAIESSTLDVASNTKSDGNQYAVGLIAKRNEGAAAITASINLGYGPYSTTRTVNLPTPGIIATSKQNVGLVSAHARISHDFEHENVWYLRPLFDVGITYVHHDAFDEQGAGAANLSVESGSDTLVSLQPGLEFGREFATADRTLIRPFGMIGLTQFVSGTTSGITASLQGAPTGTAPFTQKSTMDDTYADITLGVDTLSVNGTVLRVSYAGQFSENSEFHSASMKLSFSF